MNIRLENLGKRFRYDWIFRGLDYHFTPENRYAILGSNGSGKSTLMKIISGHLSPSKGRVIFESAEKNIVPEQVYRYVSYAAPYIELIEEFTMEEAIVFHHKLKPLLPGLDKEAVFEILALHRARHKEIRHFSSGMKQRLKLALAIASDTPVLLLDEPSTNLDTQGIEWYKGLIQQHASNRLTIIASNDPHDLDFCTRQLNITEYKK